MSLCSEAFLVKYSICSERISKVRNGYNRLWALKKSKLKTNFTALILKTPIGQDWCGKKNPSSAFRLGLIYILMKGKVTSKMY